MTQLPCDIVKDLLPLYEDNVCSNQSKTSVEEHLFFCNGCRNEYDAMHEKLPPVSEEEASAIDKDVEFIKQISKKLTFKHFLILGITILIVCTFFLFASPLMEPLFYLPSNNVKVSELYKLKNGDIYCTFTSDKIITRVAVAPVVVPQAETGYDYNNGWTEVMLHSNPFHDLTLGSTPSSTDKKTSFVFTLEMKEKYSDDIITQKSKAIYLIGRFGTRVLIWKEGQNIASAPKTIEDKVCKERATQIDYWGGMTEEEIFSETSTYNNDLYMPFEENK